MNDNKREQRCIELFDRIKQQFIRAHALEDADKGYIPNQSSKEFYHGLSAQEAASFVALLIRFTSHMSLDDFNTNWFFYSDYIYQDEDIDAQESLQATLKSVNHEP